MLDSLTCQQTCGDWKQHLSILIIKKVPTLASILWGLEFNSLQSEKSLDTWTFSYLGHSNLRKIWFGLFSFCVGGVVRDKTMENILMFHKAWELCRRKEIFFFKKRPEVVLNQINFLGEWGGILKFFSYSVFFLIGNSNYLPVSL